MGYNELSCRSGNASIARNGFGQKSPEFHLDLTQSYSKCTVAFPLFLYGLIMSDKQNSPEYIIALCSDVGSNIVSHLQQRIAQVDYPSFISPDTFKWFNADRTGCGGRASWRHSFSQNMDSKTMADPLSIHWYGVLNFYNDLPLVFPSSISRRTIPSNLQRKTWQSSSPSMCNDRSSGSPRSWRKCRKFQNQPFCHPVLLCL